MSTLDPHISSSAQGAEQFHTASMQGIIEAIAKALATDPNKIELTVGTRKAWPSDSPDPKLTDKALDALTNPDSKASIRVYAEINGKREEIFRQSKGVVVTEKNDIKANFSNALKSSVMQAEAPKLEHPSSSLREQTQLDPVDFTETELQPQPFEAESPTLEQPGLEPGSLLTFAEIEAMSQKESEAQLKEPNTFFSERLESLQTDLNSAKQQLNQVLGQVQMLTSHVSKLTEDPRVKEWADKAQQAFSKKADGLMTKLKTSALNLASNAWDRAQKWAIESPKIDAAIDSLIQRGGSDGKIELGGMKFSNVDGNRSISNAQTGQTLYAGGFLSDKLTTQNVVDICRVPQSAERYCKAYDEFQKSKNMTQQPTQKQTQTQKQTVAPKMSR